LALYKPDVLTTLPISLNHMTGVELLVSR